MGQGYTWLGCAPCRVVSLLFHGLAPVILEFLSMANGAYGPEMDQVAIYALVEQIPLAGRWPAGLMWQASTARPSSIVREYSVLEYGKQNNEGDNDGRYAEVHFLVVRE